jgi:hypothetical protein
MNKTNHYRQVAVAHEQRAMSDNILQGQPCRLQAQTASKLRYKNSQKHLKNKTFLRFGGVALMMTSLSVWRFVKKRHPVGEG